MHIDTCSRKWGNNSDKLSLNSNWVDCEFESDPEKDEEEPSGEVIF